MQRRELSEEHRAHHLEPGRPPDSEREARAVRAWPAPTSRRTTRFRHTKVCAQAVMSAVLLAISQSAVSGNQQLAGVASVIDGDTLEIHGERVRLFGVDAFESGQWCGEGQWHAPCGQRAAQALADFIGRSTVVCKPQGARSYDRIVARCYLNGRDDLASYMVQQGHALAWTLYSMDYLGDMQEAKSRRRGAWVSTFVEPWTYRRQSR